MSLAGHGQAALDYLIALRRRCEDGNIVDVDMYFIGSQLERLYAALQETRIRVQDVRSGGGKVSPDDMLSVDHLRAVYTGAELIWKVCILPLVQIEYPSYTETDLVHPKSLIISSDNLKSIRVSDLPRNVLSCWSSFMTFFRISNCKSFSNMMFDRNARRIVLFAIIVSKVYPSTGKNGC
jgi:hypothetical protein